jgi:uncharacterized protein (TIGR03118 family)
MKNILLSSLLLTAGLLPAAAQAMAGNGFLQTNLVADDSSFNPQIVDPLMLDAWGLASRPPGAGGHFWVDNAETGTSVTYIGDVDGVALHQDGLTKVTLDTPRFTDHGYAFVTGLSYNAAKDLANQPTEFNVSGPADNDSTNPPTPIPGGTSGSAAFIFVTEDGCINAWRSNTATAMTDTPIIVDYSKTSSYFPYAANSVFSGCAITVNAASSAAYQAAGGNHFFAADFRNNVIEVFNNQWQDVTSSYKFQTPASVGDLHVFNIQDLNGHLYAAYAEFDPAGDEGMEQINGQGDGHVVEYNEDGTLVKDFNDMGMLNAPWGVVIAPAAFGKFGGDLLVGNFGDGTIAAFDPATGNFIDQLRDTSGTPISIDGVWGLVFGNGVSLGDTNALYFTSGPNSEYDGLFGKLSVPPTLVSAGSQQTHGSAGAFSLPLSLSGTVTIEPRKGSPQGTYTVVANFAGPVMALNATLALQNGQAGTAVGSIESITYNGSSATITLTGVGDGQRLNLHLSGVQPGNLLGDIPINILWGDVNGDGTVNTLDFLKVRSESQATLDATTCIYDTNVDGSINIQDVLVTQGLSQTHLP